MKSDVPEGLAVNNLIYNLVKY